MFSYLNKQFTKFYQFLVLIVQYIESHNLFPIHYQFNWFDLDLS